MTYDFTCFTDETPWFNERPFLNFPTNGLDPPGPRNVKNICLAYNHSKKKPAAFTAGLQNINVRLLKQLPGGN
jgi:hypothetical protein